MKKLITILFCIIYAVSSFSQSTNHRIEAHDVADTVRTTVSEESCNYDIIAYPNPVTTFLTVKSQSVIRTISIYSASGILLFKREINSTEAELNFSEYSTGIYFIVINLKIIKIIKQ